MNPTTLEINRLCEAWCGHAGTGDGQQQRYAARLLRLLGWEMPLPFSQQEGSASVGALPYLLRAGKERQLAVYFLSPGALEAPASILERRLDFCLATRILVDEAAEAGLQYVLITDVVHSYLYDAQAEELLLWSDDPQSFTGSVEPVIHRGAVACGSLEDLRRQPRSTTARRLREWAQRWIETCTRRAGMSEALAALLIDRLIVVRFLFQHQIMRRTRSGLEQRFFALVHQAMEGHSGVGEALVRLFHDMYFDWRIEVFEVNHELDDALRDDGLAGPLLVEFALLSESRFTVPVVLESFNHGDPYEKMRVRMVPERSDERDLYLAAQTLRTIDEARLEIDVMAEGYRAMFFWFDRLTALYTKLERDFVAKTFGEQALGADPEKDIDLFAWSQHNAFRPRACADTFGYACEHGFGIYCGTPRQLRVARLLLTLHLIQRYAAAGHAVDRFPSFREVLMRRPMPLRVERLMNARRPEPEERWIEW